MSALSKEQKHAAYLPAAYLLVVWAVNYFFGFITLEHDRQSVLARDAGASIVLPLLTALLWWGRKLSIQTAVKALCHIASHRRRRTEQKLASVFHMAIQNTLIRFRPYIIFLATLMALSYLYSEDLFDLTISQLLGQEGLRYILVIQALILWFCILNFIATLVIQFFLSKRYITHYLRIRLFEIEELGPICNIVVTNFFIAVVIISCYPMNMVFIDVPETDKYVILTITLALATLLLFPVFQVRRVVRTRKEQTLERINSSLNEQIANVDGQVSNRRLVDDEARLQFIADLLVVRKEVDNAPLWPMSVPFAVKMLLILTLPLLSWMGAGIVSQLLKLVHG